MTPQELKNSILQRAIEGKLVEQRKEEGTGEELYKLIQEEKNKLIREGKVKKQKPLPEITEEEIPFDIPESWKWVRLGDIGHWSAGSTPSRNNPQFYGGKIPWLKTGDLNDDYIIDVPEYITDLALNSTSLQINPTDSVLIAMYGATIGKLGILTKPMTTNQACCACQPFYGIYNLYLFYFLMASRRRLTKMAEGGAQPNISRTKIIGVTFPLPPLAEQERIVEKIEALMPLVEAYEKNWQRLEDLNKKFPEDLKKSLLQEAIKGRLVEQRKEDGTGEELFELIKEEKDKLIKEGKIKKQKPLPEITEEEIPFDIPETWKWVRLGDVFQFINGDRGKNYPAKSKLKEIGDIPFISAINLRDGTVDENNLLYLDLNQYEKLGSGKLLKNDIVICIRGSLGKNCIYPFEKGAIASSLVILRNYKKIKLEFVLNYLNSYLFYSETKKYDNGTAQPNLSAQNAKKILLPLPPLAEQERIVESLEEILLLCEQFIKN
ncbi:restriction endonuclease subunit S [Anaerococcus tetradius]|uniref:restriction endonuclease subunit S n=1 Tax=Anaerococcus tetradius TaxID=33036 RepID=UPI0023F06974|nr:restriction endonuclease subunit S [Anaerococcus tetradius]